MFSPEKREDNYVMWWRCEHYGGNGITIYVYQINRLYTLNLHNVICKFILNFKKI